MQNNQLIKSSKITWLWRIAINQCKDYIKSWYNKKVIVTENEYTYNVVQKESVEQTVIQNDEDHRLASAVMNLPIKYREVIYLFYFEEMPIKPRILVVENVSGLLSTDNGSNYKKLHFALLERGYDCGAIVLNASLFLPQSRPRVFVIAVQQGYQIPEALLGTGPCWLHTKTAAELGNSLPSWVWWHTDKPQKSRITLKDIIEANVPFDKDNVLDLIPEKHRDILEKHDTIFATGYRRTRNGQQQLELRFDGIAGCLRTPEGGSGKQFLVVKNNGQIHARLLTVREVARLMGAPDNFILPGTYNDGYKAMGDAVALPVAQFIGEKLLVKIAEAVYNE